MVHWDRLGWVRFVKKTTAFFWGGDLDLAGWYWWLVVLVYEYIEGVVERVEDEDVIEKKVGKKRSIGILGLFLGASSLTVTAMYENPLRSIDFKVTLHH